MMRLPNYNAPTQLDAEVMADLVIQIERMAETTGASADIVAQKISSAINKAIVVDQLAAQFDVRRQGNLR